MYAHGEDRHGMSGVTGRPDQTEESVAARIREGLGECSPAERKVGRILLAGYPAVGFETVSSLAELAGVSGATVVRFTTRLGFSGFPDFQRALRHDLDQRSASPAALYERTGFTSRRATAGDLAHNGAVILNDIRATFDSIAPHDFEATIVALAKPKNRVWLVGGRYSALLAEYFAASLQQIRPNVAVLPQMSIVRAAAMMELSADDVFIAFDFRRYEQPTHDLVKFAKERKATIVLFTDQWLSPIASDADTILATVITEQGPFDPLAPAFALVESLFGALTARIGDAARARIARIEETAQQLNLY
jgi:DNA-binding MurR/RpiR family transcriptional regulator